MSKYSLIDIPHAVPVRTYDDELTRMAEWLLQFPQVCSIYQIGSVGAPGISDLDMVVVFHGDQKMEVQPLDSLSVSGKYLFIHNLYGCSKHQFEQGRKFSFFGSFKQLAGEKLDSPAQLTITDTALKKQIALEFLLKMYVNLVLQREYKTLKVRSLLLHVKGLLFDLEFLGVHSGLLHGLIHECMDIRQQWFNRDNPARTLMSWFDVFLPALSEFLARELSRHTLYVSPSSSLRLARNIRLNKSTVLRYKRTGLPVPFATALFGKNIHKAMNRLNRFRIDCPFQQETIPVEVQEYFNFVDTCRKYNQTYLPHFYTLSSSLHV
ncbi:MAG TPA: hypothetical protein PLU53_06570 [Bacteroidia bacterium]|nr:hypothetical protein [Bacteroidia bacterium]